MKEAACFMWAALVLHRNVFSIGLSLSKTIISRIENGDRHAVDAELKVLALALGVSVDWLLEEYDPAQK